MMIWEVLTIFGDWLLWVCIVLIFLLFSFLISGERRKYVILLSFSILSAVIISSAIVYGLKLLFKIPRPCLGLPYCPGDYSFPSNHAAVIFAVVTTSAFYIKDKRFSLLLFGFAILVATSRLVLNVHRLEDLLVGCLIGIIIGVLIKKYSKSIQNIMG